MLMAKVNTILTIFESNRQSVLLSVHRTFTKLLKGTENSVQYIWRIAISVEILIIKWMIWLRFTQTANFLNSTQHHCCDQQRKHTTICIYHLRANAKSYERKYKGNIRTATTTTTTPTENIHIVNSQRKLNNKSRNKNK